MQNLPLNVSDRHFHNFFHDNRVKDVVLWSVFIIYYRTFFMHIKVGVFFNCLNCIVTSGNLHTKYSVKYILAKQVVSILTI